MIRPHVWTYDEIHALDEFGSDLGWFYGLVRGDGKLMFGEIFPGYGVVPQVPYPWWSPLEWWHAIRDTIFYRPDLFGAGGKDAC